MEKKSENSEAPTGIRTLEHVDYKVVTIANGEAQTTNYIYTNKGWAAEKGG